MGNNNNKYSQVSTNETKEYQFYVMISGQTDSIFLGHTTNQLRDVLHAHVDQFIKWKKGVDQSHPSFHVLQYADACIVSLEKCVCSSKEEIYDRRQFYFQQLKNLTAFRESLINKEQIHLTNYVQSKQYLVDLIG
jgi:hypothetical protein